MGEHKFRCKYDGCNKSFNRRDYLERHATNHLQVKPYVCHQCERQFSRRDLYENHLTTRFHSRRTRENAAPSTVHQAPTEVQSQAKAQQRRTQTPQLSNQLQPLPMGPEEVFFNGHSSIEFDLNTTSSTSDLPNGLLAQPIRSDFDTNSFYGVIPGLDSERWDYYRPFKRLPALNDFGERNNNVQKRHMSPLGSTISVSEGGDSVSSSEGSGGASSNDTGESRSTNATSMASSNTNLDTGESLQKQLPQSTQAPTGSEGSAPAAAYKMWLIDRFQKNDGQYKSEPIREPEGSDQEYDKKFEWFFEDGTSDMTQYTYDRIAAISRMYKERSLEYEAANWPANVPPKDLSQTDEDHAQLVIQIIASGSAEVIKSGRDVDRYLEVAWTKAQIVSYIVHRPTFRPNTSHPALLAVLVVLGMALSSDERVKNIARMAAPNISLFVYESLQQPDGPMSSRFSAAYIGHFLAFCLLFKYEPIIIGPDLYSSSLIRSSSCRRCADNFIMRMIASVPHLGLTKDSEANSPQQARKPVWATIKSDSYVLHKGVDRGAQWREWAAYEMCKRAIHFTVYYDWVIHKCNSTRPGAPISLFNLDIPTPVSESVWHARDADEFFYTIGPSGILSDIPLFGFLKSILLPPQSERSLTASKLKEGTGPNGLISLFTFRMLAHGLINITSRVTGVFGQGEQLMKAVLGGLQPNEKALQVMPYFDHKIQGRLYHGLDLWFQQFEKSFGQITDKLYNISDALGLRITSEIANDLKAEADEQNSSSIPQYALYLVLYHYTSFIVVHEDLPVVLQVATNLANCLKHDSNLDQDQLLECLYMPLYVQWIQSDEAKAMVTTSSLLLVWVDAATGQVESKSWNQLFLSVMIYISVMIIWLHDLVSYYNANNNSLANYSAGTVNTQNYEFIGQALKHLEGVHNHPDGNHYRSNSQSPVLSVLLMSACILYTRPHTNDLYEYLEGLICTLDPSLAPDRLRLVLEGAPEMFKNRRELGVLS